MFRYNTLTEQRRVDAIPRQYQLPAHEVVPRANVQLQRKPDKSAMEAVYQDVYQSRRTDVPPPVQHVPQQYEQQQYEQQQQQYVQQQQQYAQQQQNVPQQYAQQQQQPQEQTPSYNERRARAKQRQTQRRRAFDAEMNRLRKDEASAYELLDVPRDYDLRTLAKHYRRAALKYHPDRLRKHEAHLTAEQRATYSGMFERVTKAYLLLMEKRQRQESDKPFHELREQSRQAQNEQHGTQKKGGTPSRLMNGDKFDVRLFNSIYEEHRLHETTDDGYGDWLKSNDDDDTKPSKLFSSKFNVDVFNTTFDQLKRDDPHAERQLVKRDELGVVVHGSNTAYSTLGEGNIDDYGGATPTLQYTDLKDAHTTNATLIDASRVGASPSYRSVKELQAHRSQLQHEASPQDLARQAVLDKRREVAEEERRARLHHRDQMVEAQHARLQQLLLR